MKLNLFIILLAIFLLSFSTLYEINFLDYLAPIPYSKINTITFVDFKGLKKPSQTLTGIQEFAFIKTSRKLNLIDANTFVATTYFHPSRSYVFNQQLRDFDLLSHELYHFRIAELITRFIRRDVSNYNGKITSGLIAELEIKYNRLENDMQWEYDDQTDHSYDFKEQKIWQTKIDSSLNSLSQYSNTSLSIKNKYFNQ